MKKNKIIILCLILLVALGICAYSVGSSDWYLAGLSRKNAEESLAASDVAAEYHGHQILYAHIEYQQEMNFIRTDDEAKKYNTDRDVIERIVENYIILEEAERRGISATQEEIDEMINSTKYTYEQPKGKAMIDDYCAGLGISFEEYLVIIEEMAPRTITRQKLRDVIGQEYCKEHGLEFTNINPPEEVLKAVDDYIAKLLEENKCDIIYYID